MQGRGIIHKDIKPSNLLVDNAGTLKICDFGVSERLDRFAENDLITTSNGTPAIQPPEVANGAEKYSGFKLDVWSCGVTLFNFVTGEYPFSGETVFKLFENIAAGRYKIPSHVEPVLESLIRGMMTLDPDQRLSVAGVRAHDWCRKRIPRNEPEVRVPARGEDESVSTTVIPYLCNMHYGDGTEEEHGVISEHELKLQRAEELRQDESKNSEEKTTKCIKVKKLGSCVIC